MTIETILGTSTGVRAAPTAMVPGAGQSFTLRDQSLGLKCGIIDITHQFSVLSDVSIRSPRMHDNVQGIDFIAPAFASPFNRNFGMFQPMMPQDNVQVIAGIGGGAATFDNVTFSIYYENLVGMSGDFRTWDSVKADIKNLFTVHIAPIMPASGDWSPGLAINSGIDLFKANSFYAILGIVSGTGTGVAGISGPCTGNVIFGCPVSFTHPNMDSTYFVSLSILTGLATVPVMKSADKAGTFCFQCDASLNLTGIDIILAELGVY